MRFKIPKDQTQAIWTPRVVAQTQILELRFLPPASDYKLKLLTSGQTVGTGACGGWSVSVQRICKVEVTGALLTMSAGGMTKSFPTPAAGWLVLQSLFQAGSHYCRLHSGSKPVGDANFSIASYQPGALVVVEAVNPLIPPITLELDWFRIFGGP